MSMRERREAKGKAKKVEQFETRIADFHPDTQNLLRFSFSIRQVTDEEIESAKRNSDAKFRNDEKFQIKRNEKGEMIEIGMLHPQHGGSLKSYNGRALTLDDMERALEDHKRKMAWEQNKADEPPTLEQLAIKAKASAFVDEIMNVVDSMDWEKGD